MDKNTQIKLYIRRAKWLVAILFVSYLCILAYIEAPKVPLSKDEMIIQYFHEHQAELEELVSRYRNFEQRRFYPYPQWTVQEGTPQLMEHAGVRYISENTVGEWYPDPYSAETLAKRRALVEKGAQEWRLYNESGAQKRNEPLPETWLLKFKHSPLRITLENRKGMTFRTNSNYPFIGIIWKDLVYFPEPPRIEDGRLILPPSGLSGDEFRRNPRVFATLNYDPPDWQRFESVYRQITPQWFIRLARHR